MTKSKTQGALELIEKGTTPYAAAQKMGISPSTVYRAMVRRQDKNVCPCCGQVVREGFEDRPRRAEDFKTERGRWHQIPVLHTQHNVGRLRLCGGYPLVAGLCFSGAFGLYDGPMESAYQGFMGGRDSVGMTPDGERFNLIATLNAQSRLNSWATRAAAVAAVLQSLNVLIAG